MMTAEVIVCEPWGHQAVARVLLDPASTASSITEKLANQLQLPKQRQSTCINGIGETQCTNTQNKTVRIDIKSTHDSSSLETLDAIVLRSLTKNLPLQSVPTGDWPHLESLSLADPYFNVSKPIDILLGVDVYHDILKPGLILGPKELPLPRTQSLAGFSLVTQVQTWSENQHLLKKPQQCLSQHPNLLLKKFFKGFGH